MNGPPELTHVVRPCAGRAEDDLRAAEHLASLGVECPTAVVAFHAQQCAEKYLNALLASLSIPFPRTHDLAELAALLPRADALELSVPDLVRLARPAVEGRYPGEWDPVTREGVAAALSEASDVRAAVRGRLPGQVLES